MAALLAFVTAAAASAFYYTYEDSSAPPERQAERLTPTPVAASQYSYLERYGYGVRQQFMNEKLGEQRSAGEYEIDNGTLRATFDSDGAVTRISIAAKKSEMGRFNFPAETLEGLADKPFGKATVADFDKVLGCHWVEHPCAVGSCGNSMNPYFTVTCGGSHAQNWKYVILFIPFDAPGAPDLPDETYDPDQAKCDPSMQSLWKRAVLGSVPTEVTVGVGSFAGLGEDEPGADCVAGTTDAASSDVPTTSTSQSRQMDTATGSGSRRDVDRLTTYAVLLGRGAGCGLNIDGPTGRVGSWLDRVAPPGSQQQQVYLTLLMEGMRSNAQAQANGRSPDNCSTVARAISNHPWPQ